MNPQVASAPVFAPRCYLGGIRIDNGFGPNLAGRFTESNLLSVRRDFNQPPVFFKGFCRCESNLSGFGSVIDSDRRFTSFSDTIYEFLHFRKICFRKSLRKGFNTFGDYSRSQYNIARFFCGIGLMRIAPLVPTISVSI